MTENLCSPQRCARLAGAAAAMSGARLRVNPCCVCHLFLFSHGYDARREWRCISNDPNPTVHSAVLASLAPPRQCPARSRLASAPSRTSSCVRSTARPSHTCASRPWRAERSRRHSRRLRCARSRWWWPTAPTVSPSRCLYKSNVKFSSDLYR